MKNVEQKECGGKIERNNLVPDVSRACNSIITHISLYSDLSDLISTKCSRVTNDNTFSTFSAVKTSCRFKISA